MQQTREKKLSFSFAALTRWSGRLGLTFSDQLIFSLSNFILNMILTRWMPAVEYGAYSLGFSIYLFFLSVPSSLIWEPMAVLGVRKQEDEQPGYFQKLLVYQTAVALALSLPLVAAAFFFYGREAAAVRSAALALPFLALIWFSRQICYYRTAPGEALRVSSVYFILQMAGVVLLFLSDRLSVPAVFAWTSFSSLAAFLFGWKRRGLLSGLYFSLAGLRDPGDLHTHWTYGKWMMVAGLANGIMTLSVIPLLTLFTDLESVAAFKAMQNFVTPLQQALAALSLVMLPVTARYIQQAGGRLSSRQVGLALLAASLVSAVYLLILVFWGRDLIRLLYNQPFYLDYVWLLILLGASTSITALGYVFRILLRAMNRPESIFWSKAVPAVFVLVVGIILISRYGLAGAGITVLISMSLESLTLFVFYIRNSRKQVMEMGKPSIPEAM